MILGDPFESEEFWSNIWEFEYGSTTFLGQKREACRAQDTYQWKSPSPPWTTNWVFWALPQRMNQSWSWTINEFSRKKKAKDGSPEQEDSQANETWWSISTGICSLVLCLLVQLTISVCFWYMTHTVPACREQVVFPHHCNVGSEEERKSGWRITRQSNTVLMLACWVDAENCTGISVTINAWSSMYL